MSSTLMPDETAVRRAALEATHPTHGAAPAATPRRRGRPPLVSRERVLAQLREAHAAGALFRVHIQQPALYARARRLWGSWAGALLAAGVDYERTMADARRRSVESRRTSRARAKR